jgi:phenylalanine ammonia-lyase
MFFGNPLTPHYPTHAEGFNQNINSLGFGSANLARRSLEIFEQYVAISLLFGVQAAELRTAIVLGHYDAAAALSPESLRVYAAVYEIVGRRFDGTRALIWNDDEQELDAWIDALSADIRAGGKVVAAVGSIVDSLAGRNRN